MSDLRPEKPVDHTAWWQRVLQGLLLYVIFCIAITLLQPLLAPCLDYLRDADGNIPWPINASYTRNRTKSTPKTNKPPQHMPFHQPYYQKPSTPNKQPELASTLKGLAIPSIAKQDRDQGSQQDHKPVSLSHWDFTCVFKGNRWLIELSNDSAFDFTELGVSATQLTAGGQHIEYQLGDGGSLAAMQKQTFTVPGGILESRYLTVTLKCKERGVFPSFRTILPQKASNTE